MARDKLFLISPGFADPKHPGVSFVCPYCNAIEGLLASFPDLASAIDVERVAFLRPRQKVIDVAGEENQSLPLLILAENPPDDAGDWNGTRFVNSTDRILELLAERHGFPRLH
ncbi:DUF3088 domain-containing protein [Rhizobium sp. CNPSo 4062]|uniref:DUF3088 domain-containing protein n=1 Tax=Rhizobium sp. CNPSo 4062 TaxID=3021410 RepID=UPI00254B0293|nr:DUF3088 domain-containing protein [Rhizobium sp. CNPSo 4062]MDK4700624.1 DUF3088 domain-containing protein [Rhizobium sp. CNPSo 4062]